MAELSLLTLYIEAAGRKFNGDSHISIDLSREITPDPQAGGAWVPALLFVEDDELEPQPGPTYDVWIAEQRSDDSPVWTWLHDAGYTCSDDPDGKQARANAHEYAKWLRSQYPCAFVGVYLCGKKPLPIHQDA